MKEGIRPIWEDPENATGGMWTLRTQKEDTEAIWKELLLAVIGEQFSKNLSSGDDINGVTVSIRFKDNIIELWNKKCETHSAIEGKLKEILRDFDTASLFYKQCRQHSAFNAEFAQSQSES